MSAFSSDSLVPARFLILLANLIILILALWSRDGNVTVSLPFEFEEEEYRNVDQELTVALSLGIVLISTELIGFLSGLSMFKPSINLLSIFSHGFASFVLAQWLIHPWPLSTYWIIFGSCFVLPFITEIITIAKVLYGKIRDI
ncbi:hypothetical protein AAG570_009472 [Ranatra chinensis]|uniref:Transmembrane protein 107 n=1 Tax=Ranatra chinensis TaxID=642074 RepID=A0ABD0YP61_9HEMI